LPAQTIGLDCNQSWLSAALLAGRA
jgi:hypothetical protein